VVKTGLEPRSVHVEFVVDKVALGQVFSRVLLFPPSISFHRCSIKRKKTKKLIIFVTELHNKPQGCGVSIASPAGPFTIEKKTGLLCVFLSSIHIRGMVFKHRSNNILPFLSLPKVVLHRLIHFLIEKESAISDRFLLPDGSRTDGL
jgi:hypothetical protein